ncbi:MAG: SspB family protein [Beijerinckiaceae bacterium]
MSTDHIRYDLLVQDALRSVVKNVIADAGKNGLPGEHHFYVSFKTGAPGVRISNRLREQYPDEMTIVLQHQFWDLGVTEHTFDVGLSFGGVPERLLVPYDAIVGFFDPSVQFGLKFEVQETETIAENDDTKGSKPPVSAAISPMIVPKAAGGVLKQQDKGQNNQRGAVRVKGQELSKETSQSPVNGLNQDAEKQIGPPLGKKETAAITSKPRSKKAVAETETGTPQQTAAVVSLDAFRKKK